MINDAVCNILRGPLIKYTQDMCTFYGIPLTPDITSGPIWNPKNESWEESLIPLPMTEFGKVILVPKLLVRQKLSYQSDQYYRHTLLPAMQSEHIASGSSLVELLKNGKLRVTKSSLMDKYGSDKLSIVEQTNNRPEILQRYKDKQKRLPSESISLHGFSELESTNPPNLKNLVEQLKNLKSGSDTAHEYEELIEKILTVIFYPSLFNPNKQQELHEGRKRVDITYTNEAKSGFFYWISMHYPCSLIFIECKNYGKEIGNPEIDQLAGRFSPNRGQVGLLVCRSIENKELTYKRCIDAANDGRGFMLPIDDDDIISMIEHYREYNGDQSFPLLRELWSRLIN